MNKRGIELSVNFIVTLILAIVILSFGIYFLRMVFEKSTELKLVLDQQTEMELEKLMDSGEKVSIYPGRKEVSNGEMAVFGLGVLNIDNNNKNFKITVMRSTDTGISGCNSCIIMIDSKTAGSEDVTIELNNKKKILIGILPKDAEKGTYVFDVKVYIGTKEYDSTHKIYMKVR